MIKIYLGGIGSAKTASCVRDIMEHHDKQYVSNIMTPKLKNNIQMTREMIVRKEDTGIIKNKLPVYKQTVNREYWETLKKKYPSMNVIIDEAHTIMNSRRSMSKNNIVISEWLALLRRVVGQDSENEGSLTLISQLDYRIDIIARDMATMIRYHIAHYKKSCKRCGCEWQENNEIPEPLFICPSCNSNKVMKHSFVVECYSFQNMNNYMMWKYRGSKTYYSRFLIHDIEKVFPYYNTLQWDNLISDY
jgi:hypothetical protein